MAEKKSKFQNVLLRLPEEMVVLIDDRAKQMREQMPGVTITRQDVLRQIILSALKEERT